MKAEAVHPAPPPFEIVVTLTSTEAQELYDVLYRSVPNKYIRTMHGARNDSLSRLSNVLQPFCK